MGESLCSVRDHNTWNQKNPGLSFESIQNVSASCLWVEAFINSFVFEAEIAVGRFLTLGLGWGASGWGASPTPALVKGQLYKEVKY